MYWKWPILLSIKKIQENINASKISTVKTWSILRPSKFVFYWKVDKSFWCWKRKKGAKKSFFTIRIGFIISQVHFIISVSKFLTVFKNFVKKFLDEIAIDLRSMIKRSVKICNAWICAHNILDYIIHMPRIHRLLTSPLGVIKCSENLVLFLV